MTSRCHSTRKKNQNKNDKIEDKTRWTKKKHPSFLDQSEAAPTPTLQKVHTQSDYMRVFMCVRVCAYVYIYFTILYREKKSHGASKDGAAFVPRWHHTTAWTTWDRPSRTRQSPNTFFFFLVDNGWECCHRAPISFFFSKQWTVPRKTSVMMRRGWGGWRERRRGESKTWKIRTGSRLVSKVTRASPRLETSSVNECVLRSERLAVLLLTTIIRLWAWNHHLASRLSQPRWKK